MPHTCHAIGCDEAISPALFMCWHHWCLVPRFVQKEVQEHYRPGQEAAERAINAVAALEGKDGITSKID